MEDALVKLVGKTRWTRDASILLGAVLLNACQGGTQRGRLESYRALAARQANDKSSAPSQTQAATISGNAQLSAASLLLSREDLLPCESLPPRKLAQNSGESAWVDGSWSNYARAFIVKGSAQSGLCKLEIRPVGQITLNPGGIDAFVRGGQIRVILATPNGDALIPPANQGIVHCNEREGSLDVSFEGFHLGKSHISYVMNEAVPVELAPRVCMARLLDDNRKARNDWVFILPTQTLSAQSSSFFPQEN